jgi:hypothetical protein
MIGFAVGPVDEIISDRRALVRATSGILGTVLNAFTITKAVERLLSGAVRE